MKNISIAYALELHLLIIDPSTELNLNTSTFTTSIEHRNNNTYIAPYAQYYHCDLMLLQLS